MPTIQLIFVDSDFLNLALIAKKCICLFCVSIQIQMIKILKLIKKTVNSGAVWTESVLQSNIGSECILPTFTFSIKGHLIRAMKDSGCQTNFIEESLARKLNLKTIEDNIVITVNGFNGSQTYQTKIVNVPINIGNKYRNLKAMCIPEIRTELDLPNLGKLIEILNKMAIN